mgnify:FL=1
MSDEDCFINVELYFHDGFKMVQLRKNPREYEKILSAIQKRYDELFEQRVIHGDMQMENEYLEVRRLRENTIIEAKRAFEEFARREIGITQDVKLSYDDQTLDFLYGRKSYCVILHSKDKNVKHRHTIITGDRDDCSQQVVFYKDPVELEAQLPKEVVDCCKKLRLLRENCPWIHLPLKY